MINIKTNIIQVEKALQAKFVKLDDKEYLLRPVMFGLIDLMHKRIHNDGKDAGGGQIGTYSTPYLKLREKKYGRQEGPKVVISLTRQLENDWAVKENAVMPTPKGYGIGFLNLINFQKSQWVESTYKKKIFSMTTPEHDYAIDYINDLVNAALNE